MAVKNEPTDWAVVAHAFNPSTWKAEAGRFLKTLGQPGLVSSRIAKAAQRNAVSKKLNHSSIIH